MRRLFSVLAMSGCLLTTLPMMAWADGLTLFSGVKQGNELPYATDFGGEANNTDRYILKIPASKIKTAVSQFSITYDKNYKGSFSLNTKKHPDNIAVKVGDHYVPLDEVKWNKEDRLIEIFPHDPVPAGSKVELILSEVQNPAFGGMFYFNCSVQSSGDVPLSNYLGTWIITIN